ncbi:hypothetical protein CC1G_10211 [Coprinopsis cinerea okayama7|uniref:Uncharacterized protein n=1 Tax=Coprinopsis cinerea (strain Okayama-7 / 130 / ATCC MYA-4618 / FGSC 9003) TaxID=240176 RepID=A8NP88_COPC7|nr:hypothetical protein CC1G_10211 [Coprinopsis cinerea okayama7\|eukprot:XP_001835284.2 hypothetical protein CC1G_10211 [Coprinopsis cinerea okayama7\
MPKDLDDKQTRHSTRKGTRRPPKPRDKDVDFSDDEGPWGWKEVRNAQTKGHKEATNAGDYVRDINASVKSLLADVDQHVRDCSCDCHCSSDLLKTLQYHEDSIKENVERAQKALIEVLTELEMASYLLRIVKSNR